MSNNLGVLSSDYDAGFSDGVGEAIDAITRLIPETWDTNALAALSNAYSELEKLRPEADQ